jgi:hypothetical protein
LVVSTMNNLLITDNAYCNKKTINKLTIT